MVKSIARRKHLIACFFGLMLILGFYWFKCQMDLSFSETYSLSNYVPFRYLVGSNVIKPQKPSIILEDSFESFLSSIKWRKLWMIEKGKVTLEYDSKGIEKGRCILVKSISQKEWSRSYNKFIEVKKGDIFYYEVFLQIKGEKIVAYVSVDAFDEFKKAIKMNYVSTEVNKTDFWVRMEKEFKISDDIKYIRFRLGGVGIGEYRFDNVKFKKVSNELNGPKPEKHLRM